MRYFRIWLIAVLLIGVMRLVQGCAPYTMAYIPVAVNEGVPVVQTESWTAWAVAQTTCTTDNRPIILLRRGDWDSLELRLTMVHEMTHVRQMKANCESTRKMYRASEAVRIRMETEAYCEDSKARLKAGQDPKWVKERFYNILLGLFGIEDPTCPFLPP